MVQLAPRENPYLQAPLSSDGTRPVSEATARDIDDEVRRIIEESHLEARRLLTAHRGELDALAKALLEHETLDEESIRKVTGLAAPPKAPVA